MIFSQEILSRSATDFADFLLPHLSEEVTMLDIGCGAGTITMGLAEHVSSIVGIDSENNFKNAQDYIKQSRQSNIRFQVGDVYSLSFPDNHFDACLGHSVLEALEHPKDALTEIKRVLKPQGIVGVASLEYSGIILAGENAVLLRRFYAIREQLWQLDGLANPYLGRDLRGLLNEAGFDNVVATSKYVCHGTADHIAAFRTERAADCDDDWYVNSTLTHGLASKDELNTMKQAWLKWSQSPNAYFAFPWCRVLGWKPNLTKSQ